ncbi:MAG: tetratricopeptide repeat protein [Bacteroidetes bacterium]|nr:tetratricopeptide repeat protein [Bacteroidota bacterium]
MSKKRRKHRIISPPQDTLKPDEVRPEPPTNEPKGDRILLSRKRLILLGILLLTLVAFWPSVQNGFTNWDDQYYVTQNYTIRQLTFKSVANSFSFSSSSFESGNYHPLTMLSYAIEYKFSQLNPATYHSTNLVLHLINTALVFFFIFLLSGRIIAAIITSLLFGIHPMHVESVAWISERKDLLYVLFYLLALIAYLRYTNRDKQKIKFILLCFLCFALSLLSKAMAVTLPIVLILIDIYKRRKMTSSSILEKIPFVALSVGAGILALVAQRSSEAFGALEVYTFMDRVVFAGYGLGMYLYKMFIPLQLSTFYPYPAEISGWFYSLPVLFIGIAAFVFWSLKKTRLIFFGAGFFMVTILLVLQILPVGAAIMADRYTYLPYVGLFFLISEGILLLIEKMKQRKLKVQVRTVSAILLVTVVIANIYLTRARCTVWKDSNTLWTDVIQNHPGVSMAYNKRSETYLLGDNYDMALGDLNKSISLDDSNFNAWVNRGFVYSQQGNYDQAIIDFNKAIELNPNLAIAYVNRARTYEVKLEYETALLDIEKALEINPNLPMAYVIRGKIFNEQLRFDDAIIQCNLALSIDPQIADAYFFRAGAHYEKKEFQQALRDVLKARELGMNVDEQVIQAIRANI